MTQPANIRGPQPVATPFPMSQQAFLARFPEFKGAAASGTDLIAAMLNDAALQIDCSVAGTLAGVMHGYLTAHRLALSPFGQQARMLTKDGSTTYGAHYEKLVHLVGSGFRAL